MTTYDQIIEEGIERGIERGIVTGREESFVSLLRVAYRQGIDIDLLARQYQDLPRTRVDELVAQIKAEGL